MKNNFLIYVLSCFWLGFSLDSIGQNRYHEDSTRMTEDSSWCEPHYREDGRVDNLIMVSFSYPLLLIRNNEPVTGIVYSLWPNGNLEDKTRKWSNRKRYNLKEKLWHSNGQLKRILNSSRETCWDKEGNKIECD